MKMSALLVLMLFISCASKKVPLTTPDLKAGDHAHFRVDFLKDKGKTIDVSLTGLSTKEETVVIKKEEIICGKGDRIGTIKKLQKVPEPYLLLGKGIYKQLIVVCQNDNFKNTAGDYYIGFKNIYSFKDGMPNKVLDSDIKLELR